MSLDSRKALDSIRNAIGSWQMNVQRGRKAAAIKSEAKLHSLIRGGFVGEVFNFAGLAVWVDDSTPDGRVKSREMIPVS